MKKSILLLGLIITISNLQSQDYLISFSGTGSSTKVDSVTAINLGTNQSITLPGNETLILKTGGTGINNLPDVSVSSNFYPNPFDGQATLIVNTLKAGMIKVLISNIYGQVVAQESQWVQPGNQLFAFSCNKRGVYIITAYTEAGTESHKVLYMGTETGSCSILFEGNESLNKSNHNERDMSLHAANNADHVNNYSSLKSDKIVYELDYTQGDIMFYKCYSDKYTTIVTDIQAVTKTMEVNFVPCTDADNNNYAVVKIGTQIWMAENLKTTRYNNGDIIATTIPDTLDTSSESNPQYQWAYAGNEENVKTYGRLYTWYAATDSRGVCPAGWHVASENRITTNFWITDNDWTGLRYYLGGDSLANEKLRETGTTHWHMPNTFATNESGFTALPGGIRSEGGEFSRIGEWGSWLEGYAPCWGVYMDATLLHLDFGLCIRKKSTNRSGWGWGGSVRCVASSPAVSTAEVSNIGKTSAICGGNISDAGLLPVSARGVCWSSMHTSPTIDDSLTVDSIGSGTFISIITGLQPDRIYYVRAYATSGIGTAYGNEVTFSTSKDSISGIIFNPNLTYGSVVDIDGNTYKTIQIGSQVWMAENLRTTRYNNGDLIGTTSPDTLDISNESNPKYQWAYAGNEENVKTYGRLYTWYAATDSRGVCPVGWHVATGEFYYADWNFLLTNGNMLKETSTTHWNSPNTGATNATGFTALPGGFRSFTGTFEGIGDKAVWWISQCAWVVVLDTNSINSNINLGNCGRGFYPPDGHFGYSVRCVKDCDTIITLLDDVSLEIDGGANIIQNHNFSNGLIHWDNWDDEQSAYRTINDSDYNSETSSYSFQTGTGTGYLRTFYDLEEQTYDWVFDSIDPYDSNNSIWITVISGSTIDLSYWCKGVINNAHILGLDSSGNWRNLSSDGGGYPNIWTKVEKSIVVPDDIVAIGLQFDVIY